MTGRRNPKGGARAGFYTPANVPSRGLTDAEWTQLINALDCEADDLKVRDGRSFRDALNYAINATASALVEVPKLPTAREVAPALAAQAQEVREIGEVLHDAARLAASALKRLVAIQVFDSDDVVGIADEDAPPVLGLKRDEVPNIARAAEALLRAKEKAGAAALRTMREAEGLYKSRRADTQRPSEILRLLYSLSGFMNDANISSSLPPLADHDMADEFRLFRVARVAIRLACDRAGLQDHAAMKWSDATLLRHLLVARERLA